MNEEKIGKVILAAQQEFLRHGYRRVTMGDIAEAAGMSRPALYLVYPSKEEIFSAVLNRVFADTLRDVRTALLRDQAVEKKLVVAFDLWCVRPYELTTASPDASDLLESSHAFANAVVDQAFAEFDTIVAQLLKPLVQAQARIKLPALQVARLMTAAALGFKQVAKDATQLRQMIAGHIAIVIAGLRQ